MTSPNYQYHRTDIGQKKKKIRGTDNLSLQIVTA